MLEYSILWGMMFIMNKIIIYILILIMLFMYSCDVGSIYNIGSDIEYVTSTAQSANQTVKKENTLKNGDIMLMFSYNGKYGFMDQDGNVIFEAQFDFAIDFVYGVAAVGNYIDDWIQYPAGSDIIRYGFIDDTGNLITPLKFSYVWNFNEGLALVKDVDGSSYYIDKSGNKSSKKVIGEKYFTQGFMPKWLSGPSYPMPNPPPEVWSYIDSSGELATEKEFEKAEEFSNGWAIVKNSGKYGLIDTDFNIVIDYQYDALRKIDTNLFEAKKDDKCGVIDIADNIIVDFIYLYIGTFSDGLAPVRMGATIGSNTDAAYIDRNGNIYFESKFSITYQFVDGYACVKDKYSGLYGVIDLSGNYVIDPKYDYLELSRNGLIRVYEKVIGNITANQYYIDLHENIIGPKL